MTQRLAGKLRFRKKLLLASIAVATITALVVFGLIYAPQIRAQSPPPTATPWPSFEVASIKPNRSGAGHGQIRFLPGRFTGTSTTAKQLLEYAYNVRGFQVSGGPSWIDSEKYDIDAKEPDSLSEELPKLPLDQNRQEMGFLIESLLADRFKLRIHRETKELPVFALVIAKNGPKLRGVMPADGPPDGSRGFAGQRQLGFGMINAGRIEGHGIPISAPVGISLVWMLAVELDRTVLDRTGLKGNYDVVLKWTPDEGQAARLQAPGGLDPQNDNASALDPSGPSIFTAVQEQLGLKLESNRGPVDVILIDHIERPSEN